MSKLRKSAKGRECQVRIPGVCNGDPETVVLAHLNGGGMSRKKSDLQASFCCSSCHAELDGAANSRFDPLLLRLWHREGVERTQDIWEQEGLIRV